MKEAINAYDAITATREFRELERLRDRARHNEASALRYAKEQEREKWQAIVADKEAGYVKNLAEKDALIAELQARLGSK